MGKTRKKLSWVLIAASLAGLLSGCGGTFVCDFCGKESSGKSYSSDVFGDKMTICSSCMDDINQANADPDNFEETPDVPEETQQQPTQPNIVVVPDDSTQQPGSLDNEDVSDETTQLPGMSTIETVQGIYPFKNGYACIMDRDYQYYYVNAKGGITGLDRGFFSISGSNAPMATWGDRIVEEVGRNCQLMDLSGNVIKTFESDYFSAYSCPAEGQFFVQEIEKTLSGDKLNMVYYDLQGNETMRFPGMVHLSNASVLSEGRAFIGRISNDTELNYIGKSSGWVTDITMIDYAGNSKKLQIVNPEVLLDAGTLSLINTWGWFSQNENATLKVVGYRIKTVTPFQKDESYASACVEVRYEENVNNRKNVRNTTIPAFVTKQGDVYLCGLAGTEPVSAHINDYIIVSDRNSKGILDVTNNHTVWIRDQDFYKEAAEPVFGSAWFELYFLNTGNFFITIKNEENDYYGLTMEPDGAIVKGPVLIEELPLYPSQEEHSIWDLGEHEKVKLPGKNYEEQTNSLSIQTLVLQEDGLIPFKSRENLFRDNVNAMSILYRHGYSDIWGNVVIEPQYSKVSYFTNGYAIVARDVTSKNYTLYGADPIFINEKGEQVSEVVLPPQEVVDFEPLITDVHPTDVMAAAYTILSTDGQFRSATNMALLPSAAGESLGYLYDIATFDLPGLVKHVYSDATYAYRDEAVDLILQSLLSEHDNERLNATFEYLSAAEKELIAEGKKTFSVAQVCTKALNLLDDKDYVVGELTAADLDGLLGKAKNSFNSILTVEKVIEDMELSVNEKLLVALLMSNYCDNQEYLQDNLSRAKRDNRSEMVYIYSRALERLNDAYEDYVENAEEYVRSLFAGSTSFDSIVDLAFLDMSIVGVDPVNDAIKYAGNMQNAKNLNALLFVHGLAVKVAEKVGTKDTYSTMQRLYENAIVVNALVEDMQESLGMYSAGQTEENLLELYRKAKVLVDYRKIVLDNLLTFYNVCSSGEVFLNPRAIEEERMVLDNALSQIYAAVENE